MANSVTRQNVITLPKTEYLRLKQQAGAYRAIAAKMFEFTIDPVDDVVADFKAINLYTKDFLTDFEDGLRKSSYAKKHVHQTSPIRHRRSN